MTSSQDSKGKSRYVWWGLREDSLPSGGESCMGFEGLAFFPPVSHREESRKRRCPLKVGTSGKGTSWTVKEPPANWDTERGVNSVNSVRDFTHGYKVQRQYVCPRLGQTSLSTFSTLSTPQKEETKIYLDSVCTAVL